MKVECLYDRLLVRVIEESDRTKGGLIVPQVAQQNTPYLRGEVIAVGHGRVTTAGHVVPLIVNVGDVVVFFRAGGGGEQLIFPDADTGEDLLVIREPHVVAILRDLPRGTGLIGTDGREVTTEQMQ